MTNQREVDERILILAPIGREGPLTKDILTRAGLRCTICVDFTDLLTELAGGAGAIVLTKEALGPTTLAVLTQALEGQPSWSELPLILLNSEGEAWLKNLPSLDSWPINVNVTMLNRPVSVPALVTVAQTSLRARRRQYQVRDLMGQLQTQNRQLEREIVERQQAEARLQQLNETLEQRVAERTEELEVTNRALEDKIAEITKVEQSLAKERHLLRTLIDNIPDYIYVKDTGCRFMLGNNQVVRVMGADAEAEILHKTDFDFYPASLAAHYYGDDQLIVHTGQSLIDHEEPLIDLAGNRRWLSTTKVPLRDKTGQVIGLVGISRDITRRKQMERELRDSEERFRRIFEDGPLGMALLSQSRYVSVNTKLCDMLGYAKSQLTGQTPFKFIHNEDMDGYERLVDQLLQGVVTDYRLEQRYVTHGGDPVWVSLTTTLLTTGADQTPYRLEMMEDITKRKKTEQERLDLLAALGQQHHQLRALSARLEEVQETERQNLAHELQDQVGQILTAVNFNLGYIQTQVFRGSVELVQPRLSQAIDLVETATHHIRHVMTELSPPLLDEAGLLDALAWFTERFTDWSGVPVTIESDILASRPAASLERTLFRIVQEALTNVAKHAEATHATVRFESNELELRLTVTDNGQGFSPVALRNDRKNTHWGLLAMAERAEMVNGHCHVESRPGQGTQVIVDVPHLARTNGV